MSGEVVSDSELDQVLKDYVGALQGKYLGDPKAAKKVEELQPIVREAAAEGARNLVRQSSSS